MKVTKQQLLYWGTVALIAFFFIEFFWPLMYSTSAEATPVPSPEAALSFVGINATDASILYFLNDGLISCNDSKNTFVGKLRSLPGVYNVIPANELSITFSVNESDENASRQLFENVSELAYNNCVADSFVLRSAGLDISAGLLTFGSIQSFNESRNVSKKEILDVFRYAGNNDVTGYLDSSLKINETVNVAIIIRMSGNQLADKPLIIQSSYVGNLARLSG